MTDGHRLALLTRLGVACVLFTTVSAAWAAPISTVEIGFTGMNLLYDGAAIYDAGSNAGGSRDPADADPLTTADFYINGVHQGSVSSNVYLDAFIPDVTGISALPNTVTNLTTVGNPGYFDLLIGTSPSAAQYIQVDLDEVSVTYIDVSGIVQFTFGAAVSDTFLQNLPFSLVIGDPVTVSFSAQIIPGTRTVGGGLVTGFAASGTGEIRGPLVPEPSSCVLAAVGLLTAASMRRRK